MSFRTIVEERSKNIVVMDVMSKLAQDRIVFIDNAIDSDLANGIIAQLMYLDSLNNNEITMYINSVGGWVYDGLGIIDVMRRIKSPIKTVCVGKAMSMAAVILMSGTIRQATKYSTIMLHEISGGNYGTFSDVKIAYEEMERLNSVLQDIIKERSTISDNVTRDLYLTAEEAKKLNIIDEIL